MPVLLYQLWAFIAPGPDADRARTIRPWIPLALLFFAIGVAIAYCGPAVRDRVPAQLHRRPLVNRSGGRPYFDFVTTLFLVFGLIMEFPIVLSACRGSASSLGVAAQAAPDDHPRDRRLRRGRRPPAATSSARRPRHHDVRPVRADRGFVHRLVAGGTVTDVTAEVRRTLVDGSTGARTSSSSAGCPAAARPPRRSCSRTSATPSSTTCPVSCCRTSPSSCPATAAVRTRRDRARRAGRRRDARPGRDARRARGPRDPAAGHLPRGARRGPDPALLARPVIAIRSPTSAGSPARSPRSGACSTRSATEADVVVDTSDLSLRELRERIFARLGDRVRAGPARDPAHQLRLQVRDPARGRPRLRRPVHAEPVLRRGAAPAVRPDRAGPRLRPRASRSRSRVPRVPPRVPRRSRIPAYVARGQDPADDRHRLHRRLSPLDRDRRGARRAGCAKQDCGPVAVFHRELDRA